VQAPADPQTLNRYAYTRNNPLKYVDPSGHCFLFAGLDTLACLGAWMMIAGGLGLAGVASYQLMPDQIKADAGRAIDALVTDLTRGPEAIQNTAGAGRRSMPVLRWAIRWGRCGARARAGDTRLPARAARCSSPRRWMEVRRCS
jgi:hypothetical protein